MHASKKLYQMQSGDVVAVSLRPKLVRKIAARETVRNHAAKQPSSSLLAKLQLLNTVIKSRMPVVPLNHVSWPRERNLIPRNVFITLPFCFLNTSIQKRACISKRVFVSS